MQKSCARSMHGSQVHVCNQHSTLLSCCCCCCCCCCYCTCELELAWGAPAGFEDFEVGVEEGLAPEVATSASSMEPWSNHPGSLSCCRSRLHTRGSWSVAAQLGQPS